MTEADVVDVTDDAVDDVVERFKGTEMTVEKFVLGHFYQPQDQGILDAQAAERERKQALAIDQANEDLQTELMGGSIGYAILGYFGGVALLSVLSIFIVQCRWCKTEKRSGSDKFLVHLQMMFAYLLVSALSNKLTL